MSYELVLAFDTDDAEFCRGFEAGRMWEIMRTMTGESVEAGYQVVHVANARMMKRMVAARGLRCRIVVMDDGEHAEVWIEAAG